MRYNPNNLELFNSEEISYTAMKSFLKMLCASFILIWNLTNVLSVIQIKTILSEIIAAGKSINNINYIFEKIGEQILSDGEYRDCLKKHNAYSIAKNIAKVI